tara:strand:- start:64 stop:429 length:366 start_codon:yes stop_codon:yes gene_type:complete
MKKLNRKAFVEQAYHTSCQAHFREDFFSFQEGEFGQEFYPRFSSGEIYPPWELTDDGKYIQGVFQYLSDSASDLYLMCSYYVEIGTPYYVFFNASEDEEFDSSGWVIWLPEENFNKGNKLS